MKEPIHQDELNRILLKPRFKLRYKDKKEDIIAQFRKNLSSETCRFPGKVVDHHIVIDVPEGEENFWSPQLHVEVEEEDDGDLHVTLNGSIIGDDLKLKQDGDGEGTVKIRGSYIDDDIELDGNIDEI